MYSIKGLKTVSITTIKRHIKNEFLLVGNYLGGYIAIEIVQHFSNCIGLVLFGQGAANYFWSYSLPNYYRLLYAVSGLMPIGIFIMLISQFYNTKEPYLAIR